MYSNQNQTQPKLFELLRRSQKSKKRVTWSPDVDLCQVRLFSSADPPSAVGMGNRSRLSAKISQPLRSVGDDDFPPGFHPPKLAKWRCPPRFEVNNEWQVASGEESKEILFLNRRERRVYEAIYPHPSAIPPNPHPVVYVEESRVSDEYIPLVPLTPIEESTSSPMIIQSKEPAVQPEVVEAALAAMMSKRSDGDWRNMIDQDLLVKILTNPQVLQKLATTTSQGESSNTPPCSRVEYIPELKLQPNNIPELNRGAEAPRNATPTTTTTTTVPFCPPQLTTGSVVSTSMGVAPVKDISYYRSLIQQHGGGEGGQESIAQFNGTAMGTRSVEFATFRDQSKPRIVKSCIYFKTSKGCRNGSNCLYQHDTSSLSRQRVGCNMEVPSAKRVKLCNRNYTTDATSFCS